MRILVYERQAGIAPISGAHAAVAGKCREGQPRAVGMKSALFLEPRPKRFVLLDLENTMLQ